MLLALFALGLFAGLLGSVLGIGGGIVIVPALSLLFGLPLPAAIGTSIVCVVATSTAAAVAYVRDEITNVRLGMTLETTTVLGAMVGGLLASVIPLPLLTVLYIGILLFSARSMWRRREASASGQPATAAGAQAAAAAAPAAPAGPVATAAADATAPGEDAPPVRPTFAALLRGSFHDPQLGRQVSYSVNRIGTGLAGSLGAGLMSGLLGIGGGLVKVPLMTVTMNMPIKAAVATSSFMIGVTGAASAFIYYFRGLIDPTVTVPVVLGVVASSLLGARIAPRLRSTVLTRIFAVLMVVVAGRMLWDVLASLRP